MKNIIYSVLAAAILVIILENCSPKTTKQVATSSSENSSERKEEAQPSNSSVENVKIQQPVKQEMSEDEKEAIKQKENNEDFSTKSKEDQMAILNAMSSDRKNFGQQLYNSNCAKCHKLYEPNSRSIDSWLKVMQTMGPKAKLTNSQYIMICGYLKTKAK